ncbi:hypothetical protein BT96DRAFT_1025460 [Gymnopus androsaceus JB14]|uniref:Uncharacterized protein n=1 Tax=Gymnopus androsaceus JB14 TaxID=1447944 RepID=A0A6A4GRP2_9AGAR|nr:hypothetical protein BT96DRAFT_1025460 [Gymnopus androsaceus JB14]
MANVSFDSGAKIQEHGRICDRDVEGLPARQVEFRDTTFFISSPHRTFNSPSLLLSLLSYSVPVDTSGHPDSPPDASLSSRLLSLGSPVNQTPPSTARG